MSSALPLNEIGIAIAITLAIVLLHRYRSLPHVRNFPLQGTIGATIVIGAQLLTLLGIVPVAVFFTPIVWTGYILWVDAAIFSLKGESPLRVAPRQFAWLALASIPLWLIFEAYNLRLHNWIYVGLPANTVLRYFGYAWSFATIWPAIFETAALVRALGWSAGQHSRAGASRNCGGRLAMATGALLLAVPLLVPQTIGAYLFGAVWLGFMFLLDPWNCRQGRESLWRDLKGGDASRLKALLASGVICGILWEFWNFWAAAHWVYVFPIFPEFRIFAMPVIGYLGFPAFAVECFTMFALVEPWLRAMDARLPVGPSRAELAPTWSLLQL